MSSQLTRHNQIYCTHYKSVAHKFSSGLLVVVVKALLRHKRPKHPVLQISANAMTMIRTTPKEIIIQFLSISIIISEIYPSFAVAR